LLLGPFKAAAHFPELLRLFRSNDRFLLTHSSLLSAS
jgi:hypothetical protein